MTLENIVVTPKDPINGTDAYILSADCNGVPLTEEQLEKLSI